MEGLIGMEKTTYNQLLDDLAALAPDNLSEVASAVAALVKQQEREQSLDDLATSP